jgi:cytochrome b561
MGSRTGYSTAQIGLHWLTAALVSFNYIYSEGMEEALDAATEGVASQLDIMPGLHVWVGVAVLALVVLRLTLRATQGAPEAAGTGLSALAAKLGHGALYLLLLGVPALGALTWFGGLDATGDLHALAANALVVLAGLHAAMALFHQAVLKDGVLTRMIRPR